MRMLGMETKAEVIICEAMQEKGILGNGNPESVLNTMVYILHCEMEKNTGQPSITNRTH